mgnify:CR=1 FL=1
MPGVRISPLGPKNAGMANAMPAFFFFRGDSKDQIQQSGGLLIAAGWTAATPPSGPYGTDANVSPHSDQIS